jgi:hypothetical protein
MSTAPVFGDPRERSVAALAVPGPDAEEGLGSCAAGKRGLDMLARYV